MTKVFPQKPISSPFTSFKRETFTIWMKSLLCHGNGCTVFDSNGEIVYRVDNYDEKCRNEVYVMDLQGKVIVSIKRRKVWSTESSCVVFGEGKCQWIRVFDAGVLKCNHDRRLHILVTFLCNQALFVGLPQKPVSIWNADNTNKELPWFQAKRCFGPLMGNLSLACKVTVGLDEYWVVKLASKAAFRIIDFDGRVVAEVEPKKARSGIKLGDDVLTLTVEPRVDHSLIMAIVTVYGLINQHM